MRVTLLFAALVAGRDCGQRQPHDRQGPRERPSADGLQDRGLHRPGAGRALHGARSARHAVRRHSRTRRQGLRSERHAGRRRASRPCARSPTSSTRRTASHSATARCTSPRSIACCASTTSKPRSTSAPQPKVVRDDLPKDGHHGWRYIAFGPDGKLYLPDRRAVQRLQRAEVRRDHAHERGRLRPRSVRARRAQHRRLHLASDDQGALVHRQRPRLARRGCAAVRAERRAARRARLRLPVLPRQGHQGSGVRPARRLRQDHAAGAAARRARRAARREVLHRHGVSRRAIAARCSSPSTARGTARRRAAIASRW